MTAWTLVYDGTEKTFPNWNIRADVVIELASKGRGEATIYTIEKFDTAAAGRQWQVRQPGNVNHWIIIYENRTVSGSAFSGGSIYFAGWVARSTPVADGPRQGIRYDVWDVWWLMERQSFLQVRNVCSAYATPHGPFTFGDPVFMGELYLGEYIQPVSGVPSTGPIMNPETNGIQISEMLAWMNETFNSTRRGAAYYLDGSSIDLTKDIVNFWGCPAKTTWTDGNLFSLPGGDWTLGASTPNPVDASDPHGTGKSAIMDPQKFIPITRVQSISVADGILQMLRWSPTVVVHRDYTTIAWSGGSITKPVTLNFRDLISGDSAGMATPYANNPLPLVTVNIPADEEKQIQVRPEYERLLPGALIQYKTVDSVNGQATWGFMIDKYPLTLTGFEPELLVQFVELQGTSGNVKINTVTLQTEAISDATDTGSPSVMWDFWSRYEPMINDPKNVSDGVNHGSGAATAGSALDYRCFNAGTFAVTDMATNTAVNLTDYPYVVLGGPAIPKWLEQLGIDWVDAYLSIDWYYLWTDSEGYTTQAYRTIKVKVVMTNAAPGTYQAADTNVGSVGETIPPISASGVVGLAQQLYNNVSQLSYSGRLTLQFNQIAASELNSGQSPLSALIPGAPLKIVSPNNTYTNCFVQRVRARPHFGDLEVEFGPLARLDLSMMMELWRATVHRTIYEAPSGRNTGLATSPGGNLQVDYTTQAPSENTSSAHNVPGSDAIIG
jgi:hypothetical protein